MNPTKFLARIGVMIAIAALAALLSAPVASAAFVRGFDGTLTADELGSPYTQAGGHPFGFSTTIDFETVPGGEGPVPLESVRTTRVELPPGLISDPTATPSRCTEAELVLERFFGDYGSCPLSSQVGVATVTFGLGPIGPQKFPVWNMVAPKGMPALFGFKVLTTAAHVRAEVRSDGDYGIDGLAANVSNALPINAATVTLWGVPADPVHDSERGGCVVSFAPEFGGLCPTDAPERAFVRLPTSCPPPGVGIETRLSAESWEGSQEELSFFSHLPPNYPEAGAPGPQQGPTGCDLVPFDPTSAALPTSKSTETPTGLSVEVDVPDTGIHNPDGTAQSDIKKAVVTLPAGMTINASQAEGLGVCSPAQYESTALSFHPTPGKGCPDDSKIGVVEVHSPLLEETILGDVYVGRPDDPSTPQPGVENPFDSLLALYIVLKSPERDILVTLAGKVDPDPSTGRIVTTFDDVPQLPFSSFKFRFREGARAPLVTPPHCGTYATEIEFYPWSAPAEGTRTTSSFEIDSGIGGAPCPEGGVPGFQPEFEAGTISNSAKSYSPFYMRLTRKDGEQDMTRFSSTLPPGLLGKLAGVERCPDAAIVAAATKTGRQEQASPSCPANSQIGRIVAGAGVGSILTYVPGRIYLAGPVGGDPLSIVVITPAVAGPFDIGTVVTRVALTLNPETTEVEVDGARSDPIPHILEGIPLKLRDLRVHVDRDKFIINPTSCDPSSVGATLFGSALDVFSPADDLPVSLAARFQAADCGSLGFRPRLALSLSGPARRNSHPSLKAVLNAGEGDANIENAVVALPRSIFLDQAHIRTICTRVQFAASECPKAAQYGYARAFTPLLDEPLEGPVYLRSSDHTLPDIVAALHGTVDVNVAGRIDTFKGGIRTSFESLPDAPVSKFVLQMQGGKKGLLVNSRSLCRGQHRAIARFTGQNGKAHDFRPRLRASCAKP